MLIDPVHRGQGRRCPICEGTAFKSRRLLPGLTVERCRGCGLRRSDIVRAKSIAYEQVDDRVYMESIGLVRRAQAKGIVALVPPGGDWLDIGCGLGFLLEEAQRAGFRVRGVEPDAKAAALARERVENVEQEDDGRDTNILSTLDVIEHLPPDQLGSFAESVRRRADVWVIKVPSTDGLFFRIAHALLPFTRSAVRRLWQSDHRYPHTVYLDVDTLSRYLSGHGFTIEHVAHLEEVPVGTAKQRLLLDPAMPRWLASLIAPMFRVITLVERLRGRSDALLVIARSDRR